MFKISRKIFIGIVIAFAVCFSACESGENEVTETSSETVTTTASETVSAAETTEAEQAETEQTTVKKSFFDDMEDYFSEHGFEVKYLDYSETGLEIDMTDFRGVKDPFAEMDDAYLKYIHILKIYNANDADLSFLERFNSSMITIENYSGNTDLSFLKTRRLTFDNYKGGDLSSLAECGGIPKVIFKNYSGNEYLSFVADLPTEYLSIEYYGDNTDLSFISDCKNITTLELINKSVNAEAVAEILKNSNINKLYVRVEDYSAEASELIMRAAPTCTISYGLDYSEWGYENRPAEGFVFCTNVEVIPGFPEEKWECRTYGMEAGYPGTWTHYGSLISTFTNFTDEAVTAKSVSIFRNDSGELTPMPFADGSLSRGIDFTVNPKENSDFDITEEMFPFSDCKAGVYKVVFDCGEYKPEQTFFICSNFSDGEYPQFDYRESPEKRFDVRLDFLSEEQQESFKRAYEIIYQWFGFSWYMNSEYIESHTTEDFLAELCEGYTYDCAYEMSLGTYIDGNGNLQEFSGDRGGNISYKDYFFSPIYSDENEVLFKNTVILAHDDDPYFVWFEDKNYHMVKTEEGWRFDQFRLWY